MKVRETALLAGGYTLAGLVHVYLTSFTFGFNILKSSSWLVDVSGIGVPLAMLVATLAKAHPMIVSAIPLLAWTMLSAVGGFMPPVLPTAGVIFLSVIGFAVADGWRRFD